MPEARFTPFHYVFIASFSPPLGSAAGHARQHGVEELPPRLLDRLTTEIFPSDGYIPISYHYTPLSSTLLRGFAERAAISRRFLPHFQRRRSGSRGHQIRQAPATSAARASDGRPRARLEHEDAFSLAARSRPARRIYRRGRKPSLHFLRRRCKERATQHDCCTAAAPADIDYHCAAAFVNSFLRRHGLIDGSKGAISCQPWRQGWRASATRRWAACHRREISAAMPQLWHQKIA